MRRRILLIVVLLVALVFALRFVMLAADFDATVTAARFEDARADYTALRAFLRRMPKGGDLHTHLSGAVYAERFIAWSQYRCSTTMLMRLTQSWRSAAQAMKRSA